VTLLGARHVPERFCGGYVYLGRYIKCLTFNWARCRVTTLIETYVLLLSHATTASSVYIVSKLCDRDRQTGSCIIHVLRNVNTPHSLKTHCQPVTVIDVTGMKMSAIDIVDINHDIVVIFSSKYQKYYTKILIDVL